MLNNSEDLKRSWLLIPRLITFIIVSGIVIFGLNYPDFLSFFYFAYSVTTLMLLVITILRKWIPVSLLLKFFPILQSICEVIVVGSIVYATGSINSAFSGLFILTIISAALVNSLAGTLGIASLISITFSFIIWYGFGIADQPGSSLRVLENIFSTRDAAFYSIVLHILTYFLVAFVSGFLVEKLHVRDKQLADTSMALKLAKLETGDILRHLNSGLLTIDKAGKIIYFNRAAEEILGFSEGDVRGRDFRKVFALRMPLLVENLVEALQKRRQSLRNEVEINDKSGRGIPIGISTSLLIDEDDGIRGLIAIFQDLTETKKMEEKVRAADKLAAVGELSAGIAHEIRNPLAAISGSVEVLKAELNVTGENQKLLDLIIYESIRLNNILTDFLLFARSNRAVFSKVELCRMVSDVIEVIRHQPSYADNISLRMTSSDSFVYVFGDEGQLKQILINLVVNSIQALEGKSGEITIDIEKTGNNEVILKIIDNGPGIREDDLARIFDPFFSTKKDGTGLGLAIVQRLCSNLNIDLSVSSNVDTGTTFVMRFNQMPRVQRTIPAKSAAVIS